MTSFGAAVIAGPRCAAGRVKIVTQINRPRATKRANSYDDIRARVTLKLTNSSDTGRTCIFHRGQRYGYRTAKGRSLSVRWTSWRTGFRAHGAPIAAQVLPNHASGWAFVAHTRDPYPHACVLVPGMYVGRRTVVCIEGKPWSKPEYHPKVMNRH